jgi:TPP-dependent 2-oxoacid decarboxylase
MRVSGKTVADYVVAFLASIGVRHVFGYPGSPLVPLLAAIGRQDTVQWILMRHESAAALAASATAKPNSMKTQCFEPWAWQPREFLVESWLKPLVFAGR